MLAGYTIDRFGMGGPLISICTPKVVSSWFRGKERGLAVRTYTSAPWTGGLFSLAATNSMIMPLTGNSMTGRSDIVI